MKLLRLRSTNLLIRNVYSNSHKILHENINYESFSKDYQENHVKTSFFQKKILALGSSVISLCDPQRGDMIAVLGEVTGGSSLRALNDQMANDQEGAQILQEMPRINSKTVDLNKLKTFPEGTLGKLYSNFLLDNNVTPDSRRNVQFVDNMELAYIMQRYREVHDLFHTVLLMPTNMLGEVTVKWFEAIQTKLPMCIGGALFGSIRLSPKQRIKYVNRNLPWAIRNGKNSKLLMNCYFEKRWEQPVTELWKEYNITPLEIEK